MESNSQIEGNFIVFLASEADLSLIFAIIFIQLFSRLQAQRRPNQSHSTSPKVTVEIQGSGYFIAMFITQRASTGYRRRAPSLLLDHQ